MRKRTGLRNRFRSGRGTYSANHKSRRADHYGTYTTGLTKTGEIIAGKTLSTSLLKDRAPINPAKPKKRVLSRLRTVSVTEEW